MECYIAINLYQAILINREILLSERDSKESLFDFLRMAEISILDEPRRRKAPNQGATIYHNGNYRFLTKKGAYAPIFICPSRAVYARS